MPVATRIDEVRAEVTALSESALSAEQLMQGMVKLLHDRMLKYNWVGFYMRWLKRNSGRNGVPEVRQPDG